MDYRNEAWLREQYVEQGRTQAEIADECSVDQSTIHGWLHRHGINTRRRGKRLDERPAYYRTNPERGYESWEVTENGTSKTVKVHRLAAVAWFGYEAVVGNEIHHENGVPWDTRESNIEPLPTDEHRRADAERGALERPRDEQGRFASR